MKLYSLFFATCLIGFNSFAAVPTVFQLTERSLQIVNSNDIYQLQNPEEAKASLEDPKIMSIDIARYHMLILQEEGKRTDFRGFTENLNKRINEYNKTYPSQLRQYIESVAQRHKVKIHKDGGTKIYSFQDGVEFFRDLYAFKGIKDPMIKAMVLALMDNPARKETLASPLEKLITNVYQQPLAETFLLSVDEFTETDLQMIATMEKKNSYRYEKVGNLWILGSGFSFLITRDLVEKGNKLTDPKLKSRFEKIIRYHVNFQVPVTQEYKQGAAAYFSPMDGKMTFALPSRGDLDSYTHEMTHSRFTKFTKTLDAWTAAKGYQVPYQIDGPGLGGMAALFASHGGLFNLMNEVNSWRIGESFEGRGADAQILKTLVEGYGPQAGYEATELLEKVWTPEKLAGKSIPYLIYNEIREFNKMTNDQLVMMGFEGVSEENLLKKMNFLIMYRAGRFKGTSSEVDADFVLEEIAKNSKEKPVLDRLSHMNSRSGSIDPKETAKADLSNASFEEVLENFRTTGSLAARDLLKEKFLKRLGPEHMEALVQRAVQVKTSLLNQEGVEVLKAVLNNAQITPPVSNNNGGLHMRSPLKSPLLEALDTSLSVHLYDGSVASKKIDLLNFISQAVYPVELPKTYEKTLDITKHTSERPNADVWLARLFFMPSSDFNEGKEALWGERLIHDLKGTEVSHVIKEAMGIFYKESLGKFLSGMSSYGEYSSSNLNAKQRILVLRELKTLSPKQEESLQTASNQLWTLAGDTDPQVRTSALYAILSNPMYLVKIEGHMLQALYSKDSKYLSAISFLVDVGPEMAPQAKRIFDIQNENKSHMINSCEKVFMGF